MLSLTLSVYNFSTHFSIKYVNEASTLIDVLRYSPVGGEGRFDQLTNYCYLKKVMENAVANSLAA